MVLSSTQNILKSLRELKLKVIQTSTAQIQEIPQIIERNNIQADIRQRILVEMEKQQELELQIKALERKLQKLNNKRDILLGQLNSQRAQLYNMIPSR